MLAGDCLILRAEDLIYILMGRVARKSISILEHLRVAWSKRMSVRPSEPMSRAEEVVQPIDPDIVEGGRTGQPWCSRNILVAAGIILV